MPEFIVNVSGQIKVVADNKVEAERLAKTYNSNGCYCGYHVREVGKDCDYLGWSLPKEKK